MKRRFFNIFKGYKKKIATSKDIVKEDVLCVKYILIQGLNEVNIKIEDSPRSLSKFVQNEASNQSTNTEHFINWNNIVNVFVFDFV